MARWPWESGSGSSLLCTAHRPVLHICISGRARRGASKSRGVEVAAGEGTQHETVLSGIARAGELSRGLGHRDEEFV